MKQMEIERKFLLPPCSMKRFLKKNEISYEKFPIEQFYLAGDDSSAERYRRIGERYVHTIKTGAGLVREEFEEPVSAYVYERMKAQNSGKIIKKVRFRFELEGYTFELDSFKGRLKGLNVLEVEFKERASALSFRLPALFEGVVLKEVTQNPDFTNGSISRNMQIPAICRPLPEILKTVDERKNFLKASTNVPIEPYESMAHAIKALVYTLTKSIEANSIAILQGDKDPERLHQMRVAMRKIRAMFSQLKEFFDEGWLRMHKTELAQLMRETGPKRDIDVYLLRMDLYKGMIPQRYHEGIEHLRKYLVSLEKEQNVNLLKLLQGEAFRAEMESLRKFCSSEENEGLVQKAVNPVIVEIKPILKRRYRKIMGKGGSLDENSPAHAYHLLRIEVKKMRYVMEFFATAFEPKSYARLMERIKTIQSILGDHQDLYVQREHLKSFLSQPGLKEDKEIKESIDALRKEMKRLEIGKRYEFLKVFKTFKKEKKELQKMICRF